MMRRFILLKPLGLFPRPFPRCHPPPPFLDFCNSSAPAGSKPSAEGRPPSPGRSHRGAQLGHSSSGAPPLPVPARSSPHTASWWAGGNHKMRNLKKPGLDRRARLQAASWGLQLRAEGAIRLGLGKEEVKAGTPTPTHFARVSNFFRPFSKNQFTGTGPGSRVPPAKAAVHGADSKSPPRRGQQPCTRLRPWMSAWPPSFLWSLLHPEGWTMRKSFPFSSFLPGVCKSRECAKGEGLCSGPPLCQLPPPVVAGVVTAPWAPLAEASVYLNSYSSLGHSLRWSF